MNLDKLKSLDLPPAEQRYEFRDTILYALGLGYGTDPLDATELRYVYERDLKIVPSMCTVLGHPEFWLADPRFEVDWVRVLHAEQSFVIHAPMPSTGSVRCSLRIDCIDDKGLEKGAMLHIDKTLFDAATGSRLATVRTSLMLRGDGGQGGFGTVTPGPTPIPVRRPDRTLEFATSPDAALLYRLSGDYNPLHVDPAIAIRAGFDKPILHGLCTFGIACRAILKAYCNDEPARLRSMFSRFSAPVYPGETISVEFHEIGPELRFRALVKERGIVVLDRGERGRRPGRRIDTSMLAYTITPPADVTGGSPTVRRIE